MNLCCKVYKNSEDHDFLLLQAWNKSSSNSVSLSMRLEMVKTMEQYVKDLVFCFHAYKMCVCVCFIQYAIGQICNRYFCVEFADQKLN